MKYDTFSQPLQNAFVTLGLDLSSVKYFLNSKSGNEREKSSQNESAKQDLHNQAGSITRQQHQGSQTNKKIFYLNPVIRDVNSLK